MSEIKPCPFCGGKAVTSTFFDWDDLEYMPIEVNDCDAEVTCENERCINGWYLSPKAWNTRPIEDALQARIAELEAEKCVLEDQQREATNFLIDKKLHIDSLYEEGYKSQKRITELEAERRWVPVSERLPENRATILAAFKNREILTATYYKHYEGFGGVENYWHIEGWHSGEVTHWMPLPQPPEAQQ